MIYILVIIGYVALIFSQGLDITDKNPECSLNSYVFSSDGRKCLHVGGTVPMSGGWPGGQGCLPALLMALNDVNNNKDILPGYYLRFHYNDSHCNPGLGTRVLYDLLYNKPTKLALLTGCSAVSTTIAEAAPMWNLIVVSYGSSSPALSNRKRFPTFFRTHPSQALHNPTRIRLFKNFGWTRIAILQELQELFTSTAEDLEERLKGAGMEVSTRQSFLSDPSDAVKNLKRQDARIIVGIFYDNFAQQVFCEVYKNGLYGKKYVWFILGWYADNWIEGAEKNTNCTTEQLAETVNYHFSIESLMLNQDDKVTVSGMTSSQFINKLRQGFIDRGIEPSTVSGMAEAPLAYDAIWALAFAFNRTISSLREKHGNAIHLESFTYTKKYMTDMLYKSMGQTKFFGVSGMVTFTDSGDRIAWTMVEQMIDRKYRKIAYYHQYDDNLTWLNQSKWLGGSSPPSDRMLIIKKIMTISPKLFMIISMLAIICMIICIGCFVFNWKYRVRKIISNSSPYYNDILLIGNFMCLVAAILFGLDGRLLPHSYEKICRARLWLLSLGFSLAYGVLFTKVFKVHALGLSVKRDNKPVKRLIKNSPQSNNQAANVLVSKTGSGIEINCITEPEIFWKLNFCIPAMIGIDVLFLIFWRLFDPIYKTLKDYPMIEHSSQDNEYKILPQLEVCGCRYLNRWLYALYCLKGIIIIFGLFFSYVSRKIYVRQINDSKFAGLAIYNIVVLCMITVPMTILITNNYNANFAFVAGSIIASSFLSLIMMFGPKILYIWKKKSDEEFPEAGAGSLLSKEEEDKFQQLTRENDEILRQIADREARIQQLTETLRKRQIGK